MYGSIHTHFESQYDTGNDKNSMLANFIASGARRVAVTEHGVFSSYEDLRDTVGKMKKKASAIRKRIGENAAFTYTEEVGRNDAIQTQLIRSIGWGKPDIKDAEWELLCSHPQQAALLLDTISDFEIIPGVEGYYGENGAHIVLIAKDYEGYQSLCRIISESNEHMEKGRPIITQDNLEKNVSKGHLICTSACIAGPFGHLFGLDRMNIEEKMEKLDAELQASGFRDASDLAERYQELKKKEKEVRPRKSDVASAERILKKQGDSSAMEVMNARTAEADALLTQMKEMEQEYQSAESHLKKMGRRRASFARKQKNYEQYVASLRNIEERKAFGATEMEALHLSESLIGVFGKDNFYFELQNHGLEKERVVYNELIDFASRIGHMQFIASNDVHLGVRKSDPEFEDVKKRRNVIQFTRFNKYSKEEEDAPEYGIKSDEELREGLLKIIESPEIVDSAIGNIQHALEECAVNFPKNENHYPKFCEDENGEFERLVRKGIAERFPNGFPSPEYEERLEYEMGVIKNMGYAGYHLIVADYLAYGRLLGYLQPNEIENAPLSLDKLREYIKENDILEIGYNVGPGRGSAVGSLCCYLLGITDIDPLPYGLLFERFLNVERVSMPDIDSDFRTDIREKVVDYCRAKYGAECICQIMTKSYGATKGNLRLAARYLGAIDCENNSEYAALSEELAEITAATVALPEIRELRDSLLTRVSELQKAEKKEEDIVIKSEIQENIRELQAQISDCDAQEAAAKEENKSRKEELQQKLDGFMKAWYNQADKLAKRYDELGEHLPEVGTLGDEERQIVELAEKLDGVFTGYGQHAAGTIISGDKLSEIIPLMWNEKKGSMETQCTMAQAEAKGLLKMDFLGLQNLDIITEIVRHPTNPADRDRRLQDYEERQKILEDPAIYRDIFSTGLTHGVFQFESPGMKKMLMDFKPTCFEDIILLVAAYRPGPMQYLPDVIAQKRYSVAQASYEEAMKKYEAGKLKRPPKKPEKPTPRINIDNETLKSILSPTYGCIIYQEQVMQIFQELAGYSLGGADLVRRAMSKKHLEDLIPERKAFIYGDPDRGIEGCLSKHRGSISEADANNLFDQMMDFAAYAFNKSHATAYALVAMFTAYLKKYHTADFFRSSLNAVKALSEIPDFVKEMPAFGLKFEPPSMHESSNMFTVEGNAIRYGLRHIKGFSEQDVRRFDTIQEFIHQNPGISLKVVEKYAQLGMFSGGWTYDTTRYDNRMRGNRHECLRWLNKNGELFKRYLDQVEKVDDLARKKEDLEQQAENASTPEEKAQLQAALNKITNQLNQWSIKRKKSAGELNTNRDNDKAAGVVPSETPEEILENRKWEIEYLSMPFSIKDSLDLVKGSPNPNSFENLKISIADNDNKDIVRVPAVVLSCTGPKKTKTRTSSYYEVSLMDRNQNIITRRFDSPPEVLDGEFALLVDEHRYFTCRMENCSPIEKREPGGRNYKFSEDSQAIAESISKRGGKPVDFHLPSGLIASAMEEEEDYAVER